MKPTRQDWNPLDRFPAGSILYFAAPGSFYVGKVVGVEQDPLGFQYAIFEGVVWQVIEKQAKGSDPAHWGPVTDEYDRINCASLCITGIPEQTIGLAEDIWPTWKKKPWTSVARI